MDPQDINSTKSLEQKRLDARFAMESEDARKRRETEEGIETAENLKREMQRRLEEDKSKEEEKLAEEKKQAEEKSQKQKNLSVANIKKELDKIKSMGAGASPIRSYKGDMDNMVQELNISVARMLVEEDARKRERGLVYLSINQKKQIIMALGSLLILGGIGIGVYFYIMMPKKIDGITNNKISETYKPLMFSETSNEIDISGLDRNKIISSFRTEILSNASKTANSENIILKKNGKEIQLTELFTILKSGASSEFIRSLQDKFMIGIVSASPGTASGVLIFKTSSYQSTFANMLKWEKGTLVKDVYELLTREIPDEDLMKKPFEDTVINNQDTRVLRNIDGKIVLIVSFLNSNTIVLTGNTESFNEIITRFRNGQIN